VRNIAPRSGCRTKCESCRGKLSRWKRGLMVSKASCHKCCSGAASVASSYRQSWHRRACCSRACVFGKHSTPLNSSGVLCFVQPLTCTLAVSLNPHHGDALLDPAVCASFPFDDAHHNKSPAPAVERKATEFTRPITRSSSRYRAVLTVNVVTKRMNNHITRMLADLPKPRSKVRFNAMPAA